jgi:HD-like signal output (HDOD) protein
MPPSADDLVRQLTHVPSAPRVLPPLKRLLSDVNSSLAELVAFIRLDPGIAARVLQMGNSAYYSGGNACYTVDEAVSRVGYDEIYELVSYAVASQVLVRPLSAYQIEADDLWTRSVACALAAEFVAAQTGVDQSIAYTVGLMHNVGMVAMDEWIFRHAPGTRLPSGGLPREACDAERALFGYHQAEAGAAMLRSWEFPLAMTEPVRWQYAPRGTIGHQRTSCLLHAAKWLRTAVCSSQPAPHPDPFVLQPLGLRAEDLETWRPEVSTRLEEISSLLQVESGEKTDVQFPGGVRSVPPGPRGGNRSAAA